MVATPLMALEAAAELARCQGVIPCILGDAIEGEGREDGRGGRNVGFLPALGAALVGHPGIHAVAGDTDGVDGLEEIAGAVPSPEIPACVAAFGLSLAESLARNDGHGFFEAVDDGVITGPTLTNVNDFRALLIA